MRPLIALVPAALVVLAGCSLALPYDPRAESSAEACANRVDDDLDGWADCTDDGCAGFCAERTIEACSNERDDDGDGLRDAADPNCWPVADVRVDRTCLEITGRSIASADDFGRERLSRSDDGVREETRGTERWVVFDGDAAAYVIGEDLLSGDLGATTLTLEMDVDPRRWLEAGLLLRGREGALRAGSAEGVGLVVVPGSPSELSATVGSLRMSLGDFATQRTTIAAPTHVVAHLTLERTENGVALAQVELTIGTDFHVTRFPQGSGTIATPERATIGTRIYGRAEGGPPGTPVGFGAMRVDSPSVDLCAATHSQPELAHRVLAAVELPDGRVCALVSAADPDWATTTLSRIRSRAACGLGGWEERGTLDIGSTADEVASAASLALTPDRSQVVALVGFPSDSRLANNTLLRLRWAQLLDDECEGTLALADLPPVNVPSVSRVAQPQMHMMNVDQERRATAFGLAVDDDGAFRITLLDRDDATPVDVLTRDLTSFEAPVVTALAPHDLDAILGLGVARLHGNPIWVARQDDGALALVVEGEGGLTGRIPLYVAGEPPGAFDEAGAAFPTFVPFEPGGPCDHDGVRGLLFAGALPGADATSGSTYQTGAFPVIVERAPR